ncbi:MAG: hypothetical protein EPN40_03915 [Rhodanobacteraceae bacterium]|nr:MAG: hypothetical protein EPN40_03915 [Rhodanobacteraceae bacterium]
MNPLTGVGLVLALLPMAMVSAKTLRPPQTAIAIPGGAQGIGFDDIQYLPALQRIAVPAGALGKLVLINPADDALTEIDGISATSAATTRHSEGTTSVAYADGYLFASDHDPASIVTLDARSHRIVARTPLLGGPDYVRYVAPTHELWVTEPDRHQIQVLKVDPAAKSILTPETTIPVPGGPESLEVDARRNRAYTNEWTGRTVELSLSAHQVLATWPNTCKRSHGIALDPTANRVFIGCGSGKVVVLDPAAQGKVIASVRAGAGIDIISYSPRLHHLYVPGAAAGTLTIFNVATNGALTPVATYHTAKGAHCVTNDAAGQVFVCAPSTGELLKIDDH